MRDYIRNQLQKCQIVKLDLSNNNTTFIIPKYSKPRYEIGKCYLLELSNELVNNPNTISAINWNHGNSPKYKYIKAYISKMIGTMIYVDSIYIDMTTRQDMTEMFSGWLDTNMIEQLQVI